MKTLKLPSARLMPALGQGTWGMGEDPARRREEIAALQLGLELGMTVIDTAEMYGDGGAEEVVGEAIAGRREEAFLVSTVLPQNATRAGTVRACEQSLRRLKTDYLDLYLLHRREQVPLEETLEGMLALRESGEILDFGVSNFDFEDMRDLSRLPGGEEVATDQVLYTLVHRGIEWDLLPWCRDRAIPVMAYSPLEHSREEQLAMLGQPILVEIAVRHDATPAQVALAWVLHQDVVAIPKAVQLDHVRENAGAAEIDLTEEDLEALDAVFSPPRQKVPLAVR